MNHQEQTAYLKGARDILMRLQEDYLLYIIPYTPIPTKSKCSERYFFEGEQVFPVTSAKVRKVMGKALIKALTEDERTLERVLSGDYTSFNVTVVERDKNNQPTKVVMSIE